MSLFDLCNGSIEVALLGDIALNGVNVAMLLKEGQISVSRSVTPRNIPVFQRTAVLAAFSRASFRRPIMYTIAPLASRPCAIMRPIPVSECQQDGQRSAPDAAEEREEHEDDLPVPPPVTTAMRPLTLKRSAALMFADAISRFSGLFLFLL